MSRTLADMSQAVVNAADSNVQSAALHRLWEYMRDNNLTYKLTATEYSETRLFSIRTDQIGGKDIVYDHVYDHSGKTQSAPVKMEGGRLEFKHPFEPPALVFEGNKITATAEGSFVDMWEKVP